jgi:hypothetical protein
MNGGPATQRRLAKIEWPRSTVQSGFFREGHSHTRRYHVQLENYDVLGAWSAGLASLLDVVPSKHLADGHPYRSSCKLGEVYRTDSDIVSWHVHSGLIQCWDHLSRYRFDQRHVGGPHHRVD